jgi:hypothetical protein
MASRRKHDAITGSATAEARPAKDTSVLDGMSETLGQMMGNCLDVQEYLRTLRQGLHEATQELHDLREQSRMVKQELIQTEASVGGLGRALEGARNDIQDCFGETGEKFLSLGQACRDLRQELREVHDQVEQLRKDQHESAFVPPLPGALEPAGRASAGTEEVVPVAPTLGVCDPGLQGKAALGITVDATATVVDVLPGTPADRAGLQTGDVLLGVDGKPITSGEDLRAVIFQASAGTEIRLQVAHGEQTKEVLAQLTESSSAAVLHDRPA